jgi:hypothetical protein
VRVRLAAACATANPRFTPLLDPEETSAAGPTGGGECGPHGAGRGGKTDARYSPLSRLDNCHCNFWIANGEADFSTLNY